MKITIDTLLTTNGRSPLNTISFHFSFEDFVKARLEQHPNTPVALEAWMAKNPTNRQHYILSHFGYKNPLLGYKYQMAFVDLCIGNLKKRK